MPRLGAKQAPDAADMDFPGVEMVVNGVESIDKYVESSGKGAVWGHY